VDRNENEKRIIENYQKDENVMILIFAQWCINNNLDPIKLYEQAYPGQGKNKALEQALESTVTKNESDEIPVRVVLDVLQLFGNDDLAFVVAGEYEKSEKS
jgi:hypothetical protein